MLIGIDITYLVRNSEDMVEITNMIIDESKIFVRNNDNKYTKIVKKFITKNLFETNKKYFIYNIKKKLFFCFKMVTFFYNTITFKKSLNLLFITYINYYNYKLNVLNNNKIIFLKNYFIFILNIKNKKPFINITIKDKTILAVSSGFILKKLNIDEKKSKKNYKTLCLILKIVMNDLKNQLKKYDKIILQIRGSRKKLFQIISYMKKKTNFANLILIYTPNFFQNSVKFKKIKSIKKRLRKKFIKK